ncbi:hypothetical protein [Methylocystis iwaonis]|uniref:Uncharacterized protein n=1 Tax=Methylocystis iwaonis TaxID=2885079 RepID=A0ABN6VLY7_9HYPH|nr:hypothetical protein [Methylocystis iwaonis]BDV36720.1 hypothetical protein SS37A_42500 [Methylocystis iwaonis]
MDEFLKVEYEKCLDLIKFYDDKHQTLTKLTATLSSAVPSLLLAFYKIGNPETNEQFWHFVTFISAMTALSLLLIFAIIVQVRLYFVYPARQVNAIRKFSLAKIDDFDNNQMYLDTSFGAFKWASAHTLSNGLVAIQIGIFVALAFFGTQIDQSRDFESLILASAAVMAAAALAVFGVSAAYLSSKSKYHPDISVHNARSK